MRWQDYFVVNGTRYPTGTVFLIHNNGEQVEASFICYDTEYEKYVYSIKGCTWHTYPKLFWKLFISVTDKKDDRVRCPMKKQRDELQIDGMLVGWMWYIVLMAIAAIFNERIGLWGLISWIFFSWRAKKIEKEGHYIEW